jgi:DNA polymerase III alpha subunit|tara:strand:- start:165 stop:884 length:720 start_codon:yes stop_codon:yes gene_type:complete
MLPIYKSTFSIGKSILTIDKIIELSKLDSAKNLILVEDSLTGFVKAHNSCKDEGLQLIFGLRLNCCNDVNDEDSLQDSGHKIIIFAKNDDGCKLLNKISSFSSLEGKGFVDFNYLNKVWDSSKLDLVIPFYDSFIHQNQLYLKNCIPNFKKIKPIFWIEKNDLPFDDLITKATLEYSKDKHESTLVKSIFYENKDDVEALQTYKIICGRKFGRAASLSMPNLDHFGSDEFCFQSYQKNK